MHAPFHYSQKNEIMKYHVSVTETLNKVIGVEAENEESAVKLVNDAYYECDIVLDYNDIVDVKVELEKDQEFYRQKK